MNVLMREATKRLAEAAAIAFVAELAVKAAEEMWDRWGPEVEDDRQD